MEHTSNTNRLNAGFTLIELLVSIGIFTMITTISVLNHSSFNGSIILTNLAYEIGLSIRQAQVYGIAVKSTAGGTFDSAYGIRFDLNTPTKYYLFEDTTPIDNFCGVGECDSTYSNVLETFYIQKGNRISKLCVDNDCSYPVVDISFVRPNPDAYIIANMDPAVGANPTRYGKVEVCVVSPVSGTKRLVIVEATGQISVDADIGTTCN